MSATQKMRVSGEWSDATKRKPGNISKRCAKGYYHVFYKDTYMSFRKL